MLTFNLVKQLNHAADTNDTPNCLPRVDDSTPGNTQTIASSHHHATTTHGHVFLAQALGWLQPLLSAQSLSNARQSTMQLRMPSHADADSHTARQQAHCHAEPSNHWYCCLMVP